MLPATSPLPWAAPSRARTRARLAALLPWLLAASPACLRVPDDLDSPADAPTTAPSTADELLARHVASIGGEQAVRALTDRTIEARITFAPMEGCTAADGPACMTEPQVGTFMLRTTGDGQLYRRTVLGDLIEERGFDGQRGWQRQGPTIVLDAEADNAVSREDAQLHWYFDPRARDLALELVPPQTLEIAGEQRLVDGIEWTHTKGLVTTKTMWFERATGRLVREVSALEGTDADGADAGEMTIDYMDYRDVDGVAVPHTVKVVTRAGQRTQTVEFVTLRVDHRPGDPAEFAVPRPPAPTPTPDALAERARAAEAATAEDDSPGAALAWARAAFEAAAFDEAARAVELTLRRDPREPEALWLGARIALLSGELPRALQQLDRAIKAGLRPDVAAIVRAYVASRRGDLRTMAKALSAAGNEVMAARYVAFAGPALRIDGSACEAVVPLVAASPVPLVRINVGDRELLAMLDTGAADLILDDDLARELGVVAQTTTQIAEDAPPIGRGQVASIGLGALRLTGVPVDLFDTAPIVVPAGAGTTSVDAVLGLRTLQGFQITVDPRAEAMVLVPRGKRCAKAAAARRVGTSTPLWIAETHYPYVRAEIGPATGLFLLNTGMRGATLAATSEAYARAGVAAPAIEAGKIPMTTAPQVVLAGVTTRDVPAAYGVFEQSRSSDGFRIDGMLGLDALGGRAFTLDLDEGRMYVGGAPTP